MGTNTLLAIMPSLLLLASSSMSLTGTWGHGDPEKGGARLLTKVVDEDVLFQLECWRGAPSYNSGFLSGQFQVVNGRGTFRAKGLAGRCEIEFLFSADQVTLQYVGDSHDCGFGHGVYANGRYRRTSRKVPEFSSGDPRVQK